jgi:hypothetical protein
MVRVVEAVNMDCDMLALSDIVCDQEAVKLGRLIVFVTELELVRVRVR